MGWLPRLERICNGRGVSVYSGSGSVPVDAIRQAALRAIAAYRDSGATTVLLQIGDLDLNGIRNIARPFAEDVEQFAIDLLGWRDEAKRSAEARAVVVERVRRVVVVRRLLLTAEQVEEHIGERGRSRPSGEALAAGWPYPFTAQAEALPPEVRDQVVADAIDSLHDLAERGRAISAEAGLHSEARQAIARLLDGR
jgi:hypothetical protein